VESIAERRISQAARDDSVGERPLVYFGGTCTAYSGGLGQSGRIRSRDGFRPLKRHKFTTRCVITPVARGYSGGTSSLQRRVVLMAWGHSYVSPLAGVHSDGLRLFQWLAATSAA
jgi:hypothetical protein